MFDSLKVMKIFILSDKLISIVTNFFQDGVMTIFLLL
jgi:hypothetical protein